MRIDRSSFVVAVALLSSACRLSTDYSVHDTEGREYRVACRRGSCSTELESPSPAQPHAACTNGTRASFVMAGQRLITACPACVGGATLAIDHERCRAIRCDNTGECPPAATGRTSQCVRGLCQIADAALDPDDVMSLCMAGAGASGHEHPGDAADRSAIARAACPDREHCRAASACRAP